MNVIDLDAVKEKVYSKKKKKDWRKYITVADIEEVLEESRRQERHGGALSERKLEDFLYLDSGIEEESKEEVEEKPQDPEPERLMPGLKATNHGQFSLKVHDHLPEIPSINAFQTYRSIVHKDNKSLTRFTEDGIEKLNITAAEKLYKKQNLVPKRKKKKKLITVNKDMWKEEPKATHCSIIGMPSNSPKRKKNHLKSTPLPSIELPPDGASYNPSYAAHQRLIRKAAKQNERKLLKEKKLQAMVKQFTKTCKPPTAERMLKEMQEGLPLTEAGFDRAKVNVKEEKEDKQRLPTEAILVNKRAPKNKDSKNERNLRSKEALVKFKEKMAKQRLKNEKDIERIKNIKKEILKEEKVLRTRQEKKERNRQLKERQPKRLTTKILRSEKVTVQLPNQLCSDLGSFQSTVHPLSRQFYNLQRRNLITPAVNKNKKLPKKPTRRVLHHKVKKFRSGEITG